MKLCDNLYGEMNLLQLCYLLKVLMHDNVIVLHDNVNKYALQYHTLLVMPWAIQTILELRPSNLLRNNSSGTFPTKVQRGKLKREGQDKKTKF